MFTQNTVTTGHRFGNLLDVPIHRMLDQLSAATAAKLAKYVSQLDNDHQPLNFPQ